MDGESFQDYPASLAMTTAKVGDLKVEGDEPAASSKPKEETVQEELSALTEEGTEDFAEEPQVQRESTTAAAAAGGSGKPTKRVSSEDTTDMRIEQPEIHMTQYPPYDNLDIEIDKLVYVVEEHAHTLKKSLVNRYMGMRKKWHDHENERIDAEKKAFEHELMNKQAELDREKWAVHQHKQSEAKAKRVTTKAIGLIFLTNQRLKNFSTCAYFFKTWRGIPKKRRMFHKSLDKIKLRFTMQILRRHFQIWRKWNRENVRTRIEEVIFQRFEKEFSQEREQLHGQIAALKSEMEATQSQLEDAMSAREAIEKDMKQSFMRGLTAMNIEAMAMLKKETFNSLSSIIDKENQNQLE